MPTWYTNIEPWMQWMANAEIFAILSVVMYAIFNAGLFSLGAKHYDARVNGEEDVGVFPEGYFTMLAVQLLPLTITGFILRDPYIIGTRGFTLFMVLLVYGITSSARGQLDSLRNRRWIYFWSAVIILGCMFWSKYEELRTFVHNFETYIAWSSVLIMILFVVRGQIAVAKALFHHFLAGNYTVKRVKLQWARLFGFIFQALQYGFAASAAAPLLLYGYELDPIATQGAMGAAGVAVVLIFAGVGAVLGKNARDSKHEEERRITFDLQRA